MDQSLVALVSPICSVVSWFSYILAAQRSFSLSLQMTIFLFILKRRKMNCHTHTQRETERERTNLYLRELAQYNYF